MSIIGMSISIMQQECLCNLLDIHVLFSGLLRSDLSNREKYEINPQMHLFRTVTKATVETEKTLVHIKAM